MMTNSPPPSQNTDPNYFQFEADFVGSLHCIPMMVRMKLDNCGVKLKLTHWNQFSKLERQTLVDMACTNQSQRQNYRQFVQNLVTVKTGQPAKELSVDPHPPWLIATEIPESVQSKAGEWSITISLEQWSDLSPARRFALIKLSRPSHENKNFVPSIQKPSLKGGPQSNV